MEWAHVRIQSTFVFTLLKVGSNARISCVVKHVKDSLLAFLAIETFFVRLVTPQSRRRSFLKKSFAQPTWLTEKLHSLTFLLLPNSLITHTEALAKVGCYSQLHQILLTSATLGYWEKLSVFSPWKRDKYFSDISKSSRTTLVEKLQFFFNLTI